MGSARTALSNFLFAKSNGGKFLLRIEDTDIKRSSKENIDVILNGLNWLKLIPSEKEKYQSTCLRKEQNTIIIALNRETQIKLEKGL